MDDDQPFTIYPLFRPSFHAKIHKCTSISGSLENIALGRPTWQNNAWGAFEARLAVDGNTENIFNAGSCAHTENFGVVKYWSVDLGQDYWIASLTITNRGDCCGKLTVFICMPCNSNPSFASFSSK